jgi:hypothetical protein
MRATFPKLAASSRRLNEAVVQQTQREADRYWDVFIGNEYDDIEAYDVHVEALENETRSAAENFLTCLANPNEQSVETLADSCTRLTYLNYILVAAKGRQADLESQLPQSPTIDKEAYVKSLGKMINTVLKDRKSGPNKRSLKQPSAAAWQLDSAARHVSARLSKGNARHGEHVQAAQFMRVALRLGLQGLTMDREMLHKGVNGRPTVKALEAVLDNIPAMRIAAREFPLHSAAAKN